MKMEIYKNKKTKEFYIKAYDSGESNMRAINIRDKYIYTIPNDDMELHIDDSDIGKCIYTVKDDLVYDGCREKSIASTFSYFNELGDYKYCPYCGKAIKIKR